MRTQEDPLIKAFSESSRDAVNSDDCPTADRLLAAVSGSLDKRETAEIIAHTARCPACAEDWRISHHYATEMEAGLAPTAKIIAFPSRHLLSTLLAAAACFFLVLLLRPPAPHPEAGVREAGEQNPIVSLLGESEKLKRDNCILRWQASAQGEQLRYEIQVTTTDVFQVIAHERGLVMSEYRVPEEKLANLPPGTRILWWVKQTQADGSVKQSNTFTQELEP